MLARIGPIQGTHPALGVEQGVEEREDRDQSPGHGIGRQVSPFGNHLNQPAKNAERDQREDQQQYRAQFLQRRKVDVQPLPQQNRGWPKQKGEDNLFVVTSGVGLGEFLNGPYT